MSSHRGFYMIKCSKCGFENDDNANFCAGCGASLQAEKAKNAEEHQTYMCPKCGEKFEGKLKFCKNCGLQFNWPTGNMDEIPIKVENKTASKPAPNKKAAAVSSTDKSSKIVNIILYSVTMLTFLFSFIAIWLDSAAFSGAGIASVNVNTGVSFWFSNLWTMGSSIQYYIGGFLLFIIALIGVITFGIITIIKSIKGIKYNTPYEVHGVNIAGPALVLGYFVTYFSYNSTMIKEVSVGTSLSLGYKMGSGTVLAMISVILLICCFIGKKIFVYIKERRGSIAGIIIGSLVPVFALVGLMTLCSSSHVISMAYSGSSQTITMSAFAGANMILSGNSFIGIGYGMKFFHTTVTFAAIETVAMYFTIFTAIVTLILSLTENIRNHAGKITMGFVTFTLTVISFILIIITNSEAQVDFGATGVAVKLGAGIIISLIAAMSVAAVSIVNKALDRGY